MSGSRQVIPGRRWRPRWKDEQAAKLFETWDALPVDERNRVRATLRARIDLAGFRALLDIIGHEDE